MNRSVGGLALVWLLLLLVLAEEIVIAYLAPHRVAPGIVLGSAIIMIVIVGFAFMRLHATPPLGQAFVIAGLFWLLVLLGLGGIDPFTRVDYPVAVTRYP